MTRSLATLDRCWRAALLVAAAAVFTPGRAAASCGDHVTILPVAADVSQEAPAKADHHRPAPAKPPCHGPNCSNAPVRDAPVPPAPPTVSPVKESAHPVASADPAAGDSRVGSRPDPTSPRPIRRVSSVFHPPRLG